MQQRNWQDQSPQYPHLSRDGQLLNGVSEPVLLRAFEYLRNVDKGLGDRVDRASAPHSPDRAHLIGADRLQGAAPGPYHLSLHVYLGPLDHSQRS
jgi:hypothetical protein